MQERDELRALKREIKMSREGKVKRKICVWKRKERRKKREVNEREKEKKKRKERKRFGKKDMKWMNQERDE
jgi:hypothetical protein